ncbi:MAG: PTS fructose transporter subunit IIC [Erysipelotrichaceae bacterium]|nr:PTS fructose transporter subunit IIC [Erysipelotrichaceae bacterium]
MTRNAKGLGSQLFKYFNTGISYFLPVIIAGGMMFSFALMTGTFQDGTIVPSNQFWQDVYNIGQAGFSMMVPVLCAYIAYAIGSKPALAPGFILGYVANNPIGSQKLSTGFLGALILGYLIGYFVKWMKGWKIPEVLKPMMPTFFIPLITTFVLGIVYVYVMTVPINMVVQCVVNIMNNLNGTSVVLVGIGIGVLAAADFGGPCSKAATAFTLALMAQGLFETNGVFRMCCAIPPLGMGLAALLLRNKFDKADRQLGISSLFLSFGGITEGAIPFAGKDFKRTWIACVIGTAVAGAIGMLHGISSVVAFGGIFAVSGVVVGKLWYVVDMLIGAAIIVLILAIIKPNIETETVKEEVTSK